MSNRSLYLLGATIGGIIGGLLPGLWGAGDFSGTGIFLSMVGSFFGIWATYKFIVA